MTRPVMLLDFGEWAVVRVSGPDAREFLQGAGTQDIAALEPGAALPSLFLTAKGRPVALTWIASGDPGNDAYLLLVEPGGATALPGHLDNLRVMEELEIAEVSGPGVPGGAVGLVGVSGDRHEERARALAGQVPGAQVLRSSPMSFVLDPEKGRRGTAAGLGPFASPDVAEAWRIAVGLPRAGVDFGGDRLATELALENAISLTKGCYVGQEVVARTTHRGAVRRRRVGFRYTGTASALPRGTKLRAGGETAGILTSSTLEPGTGRGLGMGYLTTEALENPAEVNAIHETLTTTLEVAPWPL